MRRTYVDKQTCGTCKLFVMHKQVSKSRCTEMERDSMGFPFEVTPSRIACKRYEPEPYKYSCECGTFMEPWFKYCPNCGKKRKCENAVE